MRVNNRQVLSDYWQGEGKAEQPLKAWLAEAENAEWKTPVEVTRRYCTASILKAGRVVFNIGGNKFRLVVRINYEVGVVLVRWVGWHKDYNKIDAQTI